MRKVAVRTWLFAGMMEAVAGEIRYVPLLVRFFTAALMQVQASGPSGSGRPDQRLLVEVMGLQICQYSLKRPLIHVSSAAAICFHVQAYH